MTWNRSKQHPGIHTKARNSTPSQGNPRQINEKTNKFKDNPLIKGAGDDLSQKNTISGNAINRYKTVINEYETTVYVEEALHRLVELHYKIGLISEAKKYAQLLGYNYQSSQWYKNSYKIFNKEYKIAIPKKTKKSNFIIKKYKSIFNANE